MADLLIGHQRPRIEHVPPIKSNSRCEDAIEFAAASGLFLDDWQKYVMAGMLGVDENDLWVAFEVCLIVSRQNGKGSILEARELAGLFLFNSDRQILHTAHEHKTASEHYSRIKSILDHNESLSRLVSRHSSAYGHEFIETVPGNTIISGAGGKQITRKDKHKLNFIARSAGSGRGFTSDLLVYDEDMILDASKVGASMPSLSARPNPQVIYAGSAGNRDSSQLAAIRRRGIAQSSARLAFYEWSAELCDDYCPADCTKHDDPDAEETVAKANPSYNIRILPSFIESEREAFEGMPEEYYRERLGVGTYPAPADGWFVIPKRWYNKTLDKTDSPPRVTRPVFAVDASPDRKHAAIAVSGMRPDGRSGVQVIDYRDNLGWVVQRVKDLHEKWKPKTWIVDKRAAAGSLITELTSAGIPVEFLQASQVAHACGLLFDAFKEGDVIHYGQAELRSAIAGVDQRKLSESWAFDRINSGVDISPLMAVTFAHWGFMEFGEEEVDAADSLHFDLAEIMRIYRAGRYGPDDIRRLHQSKIITDVDLEVLANEGIRF